MRNARCIDCPLIQQSQQVPSVHQSPPYSKKYLVISQIHRIILKFHTVSPSNCFSSIVNKLSEEVIFSANALLCLSTVYHNSKDGTW